MTKMATLKISARNGAKQRGHLMTAFTHYTEDNAVSHCIHCNKEVQVLSNPKPNEIDIGGEAVALGCGD